MSSEERAEVFAEFLEKEQWKMRPEARASTAPPIRATIDISTGDFTASELTKVLAKLKAAKAARPDKISAELLKALSKKDCKGTLRHVQSLLAKARDPKELAYGKGEGHLQKR